MWRPFAQNQQGCMDGRAFWGCLGAKAKTPSKEQPLIYLSHLIRAMRDVLTNQKTMTEQDNIENTPKNQPKRLVTFETCGNYDPNGHPTLPTTLAIYSMATLVHWDNSMSRLIGASCTSVQVSMHVYLAKVRKFTMSIFDSHCSVLPHIGKTNTEGI